jgi:ribosome-binding protein aMBF1 (putative translation factor)
MWRVNGADIRKFAPQSQAKKTQMNTNSRKPAPEAAISGKVFPDLREILPARIREARGGLTGREFARRVGIVSQSLAKYERVGYSLPGADLLRRMAIATGVSVDWLLGLTDERERGARQVCPTATANATAPNATATANAGTLPTDAVADLLRRVLAASSTRAADPTEQRLAALERGLAALASQLAAPR